MQTLTKLALLFLSLTLWHPSTKADLTVDCPNGSNQWAYCTAYGTIGPFSGVLPGGVQECTAWLFQSADGGRRYSATILENPSFPPQHLCNQDTLQSAVKNALTSGLVVQVYGVGNTNVPPGMWTCAGGRCQVANTNVNPGPKPETCSINTDLAFVHGATSPGITPSPTTLPLPVVCTGASKGRLSLRGSNAGTLRLGASGLSSTLSVNNQKLGGTLNFNKGTTSLSITSTISGSTSSVGTVSGSGVLVLDIQ